MWKVDSATGKMIPLLAVAGIKEPYNAPRQQLPKTFWQTGHIDAIRPRAILEKDSMSGDVIMPLHIDPLYTVDIDSPADWVKYQRLVTEGGLEMVEPGPRKRLFPNKVDLLVMDFDGVLTDNRVWVDEQGRESVACNRSDSLGLGKLRDQAGIKTLVLSKETNPVVQQRCKKLKLECIQAVEDKGLALGKLLRERNIDPAQVIYMGNDTNDLPCFPIVGFAVAPSDAQPEVLQKADHVTSLAGGHGAVRELCDLILSRRN
jgi:N-acylneuraminate cytidylyltransferase